MRRIRSTITLQAVVVIAFLAATVALMLVTGQLAFAALGAGSIPFFVIGATNEVFLPGNAISIAATDPVTPASGDPILYGQLPGVSLVAERADGTTSARLDGIWNLSVKGVTTAAANSAVAGGDLIYYVPGNTPKLSKAVGDAGAVRFGYALDPVNAGATATIRVKVGY
jgi:hypothetical protein